MMKRMTEIELLLIPKYCFSESYCLWSCIAIAAALSFEPVNAYEEIVKVTPLHSFEKQILTRWEYLTTDRELLRSKLFVTHEKRAARLSVSCPFF